jgi:hypothetical protein
MVFIDILDNIECSAHKFIAHLVGRELLNLTGCNLRSLLRHLHTLAGDEASMKASNWVGLVLDNGGWVSPTIKYSMLLT